MKNILLGRRTWSLLALLLLLLSPPLLAADTPPTIPGRLVLKLKPGATPVRVEAALRALGAGSPRQKFPQALPPDREKPGSVDLRPIYQVEVPGTLSLDRARAVLLATGAVDYVEPLYIRQPLYQPNDPLSDSTIANVAAGQYYLKQIQAYRGWDVSRGDSSIVIGITDGGVRLTHEDLKPQIKHNYADPIDGIDNDHDGYVDNFTGWDLANNDNNAGYDINIIHGSLVTGCAVAKVDNARGIAGVGHSSRFMPLNIYPNTATGTFAGFEAIVYGADHGCQVIVMAWGATGGYSQFEQDAVTYAAVNRDAVLVGAAGNTHADLLFYPASYEHVLSVSGVGNTDVKSPNATFSRRVDLVAPGVNILTTYGYHGLTSSGPADADYIAVGGTSFAAPIAAGAAALLRFHFPSYTAAQVIARLRQTTDNIYGVPGNAAYVDRLGTGRLNVVKALTRSNVYEARVVSSTFAPNRRAYAPGEAISLAVNVQNLLQPVSNLNVTLSTTSPYLSVVQGSFAVGSLATLAQASNGGNPFQLTVAAAGIPLNTVATLRYHLTADNGFQLDQYVDLLLNPDYVVLNANDLALTMTSRGNLAYDNLFGTVGEGVTYRGSSPLLSEGGLLLATSATRVSDRLRTSGSSSRQSFFRLSQATRQEPGPRADQEASSVFQDTIPGTGPRIRSVGLRVRQHAYAWSSAARRDFVIMEYSLRNITPDTIRPLHAGLFMDWDLPDGNESGRNAANWDDTRQLGYVYDVVQPAVYAGVRLLTGGSPSVYSINNNAGAGTPVRLADGFSLPEKFLTLNSGTTQRSAGLPGGADVSQVVGTRLASLAPGDSTVVAFAVLAAPNLALLQAAADAALAAYAAPLPDLVVSSGQSVLGDYNNVTVTGTGVATLSGPLTVNGTLTVQDGGILNTNCQPITGPGSFVLAAGAELGICHAAGISLSGPSGAVQVTGARSFSPDASYMYNGTVSQVTGSGLPTQVRNLSVANAAGLTLTQGVAISQVLRLSSGNLSPGGQTLTLLSSASGTALVHNVGGSVNGSATVQRWVDPSLNPGRGYRHFSAPITTATVASLAYSGQAPMVNAAYNTSPTPGAVVPFPTVFQYDDTRLATSPATGYSFFDRGWESPQSLADPLLAARGYTVNITGGGTVAFTGPLHNGTVSRSLTYAATPALETGWNLIGNPYPSPLDWSNVSVPAGVGSAMYVFQSTGQYAGQYRSYQNGLGSSPIVPLGQGFFVRTTAPATLSFTNSNRMTVFDPGTPNLQRGTPDLRPQLQLALSGPAGITPDETILYFEAGATPATDARFDAYKLTNPGNSLQLATLVGPEALSINGLPPLSHAAVVVPLLVAAPQAGTYTLRVAQLANFAAGTSLWLRDAQAGTLQPVAAQATYALSLPAGAASGRFSLEFRPGTVTATTKAGNASFTVYPNPAHSAFSLSLPAATTRTATLSVSDALGRVVRQQALVLPASGATAPVDVRGLSPGLYSLRLQVGDAVLTQRVVVE
jgi:serine protease